MEIRDFIIVPYAYLGGFWTLHDSEMGMIFDRMVAEKTLGKVFYDGKMVEKSQFIAFFKSPGVLPVTAWTIDQKPILLSWLTNMEDGHAMIHFCGFRNCPRRILLDAAHGIIKIFASQFSCLMGITPEAYSEAVHLARLIGMRVLGTIPSMLFLRSEGRRVGGVISYLDFSLLKGEL
jgi:hypothetical protein